MRHNLISVAFVLVAAGVVAMTSQAGTYLASGEGGDTLKSGPLTFKVSLVQEATYRHPHPPAGDPGDTFSTTLRLNAIGNVLGVPSGAPIGTMSFHWDPSSAALCRSVGGSCSGMANIEAVTRLPGGTITAGRSNVSLSSAIVLPVQRGSGIFKGVKGSIQITPLGMAVDVFHLVMSPSS